MNFQDYLNKISPALFGLMIICFFLPFTTVSCQNINLVTLSGYQLATGTEVKDTSGLLSSGFGAERWNQYAKAMKDWEKKYSKRRRTRRSQKKQAAQERRQAEAAKAIQTYRLPGSPIAALSFGVICAGLVVGFSTLRQRLQLELALSGIALVLMVLLKISTDGTVNREGHGLFRAEYGEGYWLSIILLFGALSVNGYRYWQTMRDD